MRGSWLSTCFLIFVCDQISKTNAQVTVTYSIYENRESGHYLGNIATDTTIFVNVSNEEKTNIKFTFYNENKFTKYFVIDDVTGNLSTSAVNIDRDHICAFDNVCQMTFEISVKGQMFFSIPVVKVTILDENDNPPTFMNAVELLEITEQESVGTYFRLGEAFDADLPGNHTIQDFQLEQSDNTFSLEITKISDTFTFGIKLTQPLDRETNDVYIISVVVTDGGNPVLSGTHRVTIRVLDANDNSPVFDQPEYLITVDENIAPHTVFLTVSAHDLDIGVNKDLTYMIKTRQPNIDTITRLFKVEESSGAVSVISELTHEPSEKYEFYVDVSDSGDIPLTNTTLIKVTVNDVENNAPSIELNLLSPGNIGFVNIEENQPKNVLVAHVNVFDNDKGENGQFSCNITNDLFVLEKFQGRGFKIIVDGVLDREVTNKYNVTVLCHDHGNPPKYASESFLVMVTDVNDNDPDFVDKVYATAMRENNTIGQIVTRVTARDADLGRNGSVEYLLNDSNKRFSVNNATGVISAITKLDRETEELVVFKVFAVDHGSPRRTGTATVSLTVNDVNDNAPVIVPARPEFTVPENGDANVTIGLLNALDLDIGINGVFDFAMAPIDTVLPFEITPAGEVIVTMSLDREKKSRYEIPVTVTDHGYQKLSSTQYVTIFVTDVNDNAPTVTFPSGDNDTVTFLYQLDIYNVVTTIAAYDVDSAENGTLSFTIVGGNDEGIFEIDQHLGELSIAKYIDITQDRTVTLVIEVKDKADIPRSTRCTLKIDLVYANATGAKAITGDVGNKYIIISVVVIVTTIAVAVAIIGVILFLRNIDNKKAHEDVCARYSDSGISSNTDSHQPEVDFTDGDDGKSGRKKKEVSFSLEFSLDGLDGGRNAETSTDDANQQLRFYDAPPSSSSSTHHAPPTYTSQRQERIDSHMKALKLQQYLWEAKSRDWENTQVQQLPLGDSESETSRETITCDSGRGGSEDDVSTSSPITDSDKNFFNLTDSRPQKKVSFLPPVQRYQTPHTVTRPMKESTPIQQNHAPPRPPSYKYTTIDSHNTQAQDKMSNPPRLAFRNFTNTSSHLSTDPSHRHNHSDNQNIHRNHQVHHSEPWRDLYYKNGALPLRMRHDSESSFRSNDDDGGSTTTSGSYTLDQTDNDLGLSDPYAHQRDLVV